MAFNGTLLIQLEDLPEDLAPGADVLALNFYDCPDGNLQEDTIIYFQLDDLELELIVTGPLHFKKGWEVVCMCADAQELTNLVRLALSDGAVIVGKRLMLPEGKVELYEVFLQ